MSTNSDIQPDMTGAQARPNNFASRLLSRAISERQKSEAKKTGGEQSQAIASTQSETKEPVALAK
jgi:hypothetical protein